MSLSVFLRRLALRDDRYSFSRHLREIRSLYRWKADFLRDYPGIPAYSGPFTAILLSYQRPQNINLLTRVLLNMPAVGTVIVSNNNPDVDIRRWLYVQSDRLRVINQPQHESTTMRQRIAREYAGPGKYFLMIDDDIFLRPEQLESLCKFFEERPAVPHGIWGKAWQDGHFSKFVANREAEVDILNRVYAYSSDHLAEFFRLTDALGMPEGTADWRQNWWDDIVLSFGGPDRPLIHSVGPFVDCPSQGSRNIAVWRSENFNQNRETIMQRLLAIKPRS